jgi:ribosomal protein L11 methylase PrmA
MMTPKLKTTKERTWTVISCQCDPLDEEICSWLFFQYDSLGVENKILDDGRLILLASFSDDNEKIKNIAKLRSHFEESGLANCAKTLSVTPLADQDWLTNWKIHFEPFKIGNSLLVCPKSSQKNTPTADNKLSLIRAWPLAQAYTPLLLIV